MKTNTPFFPTTALALGVLIVSISGCSVFSGIGDGISQGYENTVSYFNAYYNAQRLFAEAEAEVLQAEASQRGKSRSDIAAAQSIPSGANQKFNQVIDKCSNILSYHPSSALVDDALLLIGKSYFYQREYLKAERKFVELTTQFPNSSELLEAQLWLARSYVRNKKTEQALQTGEVVIAIAEEEGEDEIGGQVSLAMATMYLELSDFDAAISHFDRASVLIDDDAERAYARSRMGDLYFQQEEYERSLEAYLSVSDITSDPYLVYYGTSRAAMVHRALKREEQAFALVRNLLDDYRLAQYWNEIRFEEAMTMAELGRIDEALRKFEEIDTTAVRTEIGSRSAFERARLLEQVVRDYPEARSAYERATLFPVPDLLNEARRKQTALSRHAELSRNRQVLDSLKSLPDSLWTPNPVDTLPPLLKVINKDSVHQKMIESEFALAELFYSELAVPDSAAYWYLRVLDVDSDTARLPRSMYIMADIVRERPDLHPSNPQDWYWRIVNEFPHSRFSMAAREALNLPIEVETETPGENEFRVAEQKLEDGNYDDAIQVLHQIAEEHEGSPVAARSQYMIGWIYEQRMERPDSAILYYQTVMTDYGATPYAADLRDRIAPEVFTVAKEDTVEDTEEGKSVLEREAEAEREGVRQPVDKKKEEKGKKIE